MSWSPCTAGGPRSTKVGQAIVAACVDALATVRGSYAARTGAPSFAGVGISAPGPVDPAAGVILDPPNIGPTFREIPLASLVGDALGLPCLPRSRHAGRGPGGRNIGAAGQVPRTSST